MASKLVGALSQGYTGSIGKIPVGKPAMGPVPQPQAGDSLPEEPIGQTGLNTLSFIERLLGMGPFIDPATGQAAEVSQAGIGPLAVVSAGLAGLAAGGVGGAVANLGGAVVSGLATGGNGTSGALPAAGVDGIPISGPGVPEPPREMVAKQWVTLVNANDIGNYYVYFFKLHDGRIMCYNPRFQEWKIWRPKKHIVISSNPRIKMLSKLNKLNKRVEKMLKPYQPKAPRTRLVPSRALSSIERAALK